MKLECCMVCINYSDFLAETLPINRRQFDKMVIVTAPEDKETQRVCDYWDVDVVLTDVVDSRWGNFAKAKGINAGLEHLDLDGWVLHLDADIALPPRSRTLLEHADLDPSHLYGADRLSVPDHEAWRAHQASPSLQHDGYHVRLDAFHPMARFNAWHLGGYAPVGYFQLWNPGASGVTTYPADHSEADRTDVLFAQQWPRRKRQLLPELAVYHLESEPAEQGANWGGRRTARFGVEPSPERTARREHRPWRHHHHRPELTNTPPAQPDAPADGYGC